MYQKAGLGDLQGPCSNGTAPHGQVPEDTAPGALAQDSEEEGHDTSAGSADVGVLSQVGNAIWRMKRKHNGRGGKGVDGQAGGRERS